MIYETIVGSTLKGFNTTDSDIDTRGIYVGDFSDLFHPFKISKGYERHYKRKRQIDGKEVLVDLDLWELTRFSKSIEAGDPNLLTMLWSTMPITKTESSETLIENRHRLIGDKVKLKTKKFAKQKLNRALSVIKNPQNITTVDGEYRSPEKYLVYGIAAMVEVIELVMVGNIQYPLNPSKYQFLSDLREGKMKFAEGLEIFNELEEKLMSLKIGKMDKAWLADWTIKTYKMNIKE